MGMRINVFFRLTFFKYVKYRVWVGFYFLEEVIEYEFLEKYCEVSFRESLVRRDAEIVLY